MSELRPGLWHWEAPHPNEPWHQVVSSYAIDDGDRLRLFDAPIEQRAAQLRQQTCCGHSEAEMTSGLVAYVGSRNIFAAAGFTEGQPADPPPGGDADRLLGVVRPRQLVNATVIKPRRCARAMHGTHAGGHR